MRDPETHKMLLSHRVAFSLENGFVAQKLDICHKCDNPVCVRPSHVPLRTKVRSGRRSHLFAGTEFDNLQDAVRKGRAGFHKVTLLQIHEVRDRVLAGERQKNLAAEFGVHQSSISSICANRTRKKEILCSASI